MAVIARSSEMVEVDAAISGPVAAVKADIKEIKGIKEIMLRPRSKVQGPKAEYYLESGI